MHERLNSGLKSGMIGNLLFIAFGLICAVFYATFDNGSIHSRILEILAYVAEIAGFGVFIWGDWLIATSIRMRKLFKIGISLYIFLEAIMMILEINSYRFEFYKPYSMWLAILHSTVSGLVCLSFIELDPHVVKLEIMTVICIALMFGGMFGNILGIRIYFSIIINAIAFSLMFFSVMTLLKREDIEIDCHGDKARVAEFKSPFFDE